MTRIETQARKLFFLCVFLISYFSLYPWKFVPGGTRVANLLAAWQPLAGRSDYFDLAVNFFFYVPLGALGVLAWGSVRPNWWRWPALFAGGAALSLTLEVAQAWIPGRVSGMRDLLMNTLGALAGMLLGSRVLRRRPAGGRLEIPCLRRPMTAVLASAWLVAQCFPFLPILRLVPLRESLAQLARVSSYPWLGLADTFVSCLVLAYLLREGSARSIQRLAVLAAFLVFPLRLFLSGGAFHWLQVAAAASAFALSLGTLRRFSGEAKLLAVLALLLTAARELAPYTLAGTPSPFYFTPFGAFLEANRDAAIRVAAGKFFLYGSSVWMLREAGQPLWKSAGLVALLLSAGEAAQRYLPGRVAESTDPLLALLAGLLMVWLRDRRAASSEGARGDGRQADQ